MKGVLHIFLSHNLRYHRQPLISVFRYTLYGKQVIVFGIRKADGGVGREDFFLPFGRRAPAQEYVKAVCAIYRRFPAKEGAVRQFPHVHNHLLRWQG